MLTNLASQGACYSDHARTYLLFTNNNILDWSKFKASADDNLNVAKIMTSLHDRIENIVGKGENAGYQHFLLFPQYFQKASSTGC